MAKKHRRPSQESLLVVSLRYVSAPDGDAKLSRAIDTLLRAGAREPKESINAKKEEEPPKYSRPEKVAR